MPSVIRYFFCIIASIYYLILTKTEKSCIYCTLVLIIKSISTFKCKILLLYGNKLILISDVSSDEYIWLFFTKLRKARVVTELKIILVLHESI